MLVKFLKCLSKKKKGLKRERRRNTLSGVAHPKPPSYLLLHSIVSPLLFFFLLTAILTLSLPLSSLTFFASFTLTPTSHHSRHPFFVTPPLRNLFPPRSLSLYALSLISFPLPIASRTWGGPPPLGYRQWWSGWAVMACGREWETWKWGGGAQAYLVVPQAYLVVPNFLKIYIYIYIGYVSRRTPNVPVPYTYPRRVLLQNSLTHAS